VNGSRTRTRIVVVGGGDNCEHDVSLASAAAVARSLDPCRYDTVALTIDADGSWLHADGTPVAGGLSGAVAVIQSCDVVFPAVHGQRGEDGTLAALCELAGTPYVGAGVRAGAIAMDKWATKLVAEAVGIRTAPAILMTARSAEPVVPALPVVVKPVAAGSSHGVTRVDHHRQLAPAITTALRFDDRVLVEELVVGREVDIAVIDTDSGELLVGPPLEIRLEGDALFHTDSKYDGTADFGLPADLGDVVRKKLEDAALTLFESLGCQGLARFDFFVTGDDLVLNEVNTMPGMTEHSQLPMMFAAAGLSYPALVDRLVESALGRARQP